MVLEKRKEQVEEIEDIGIEEKVLRDNFLFIVQNFPHLMNSKLY